MRSYIEITYRTYRGTYLLKRALNMQAQAVFTCHQQASYSKMLTRQS